MPVTQVLLVDHVAGTTTLLCPACGARLAHRGGRIDLGGERQLAEVVERLADVVTALVEEVGQSPARNRAFDGAGLTRNLQEARRILRQGK